MAPAPAISWNRSRARSNRDRRSYTILMLHAGIQGQVPHLHGGLTPGQLAPLHPPVDYLALGHVHNRLEMDGWIYNPGSTETNSMEEAGWPHGFFEVEVDTSSVPKHNVRAIPTPGLRPFRRVSINAESATTLDEFLTLCEEQIDAEHGIPEGAVIELNLGGVAPFRRQDVPVEFLEGLVKARFTPLTVRVRNLLVPPGLVTVRHGERLRRDEIEREVIDQLVFQDGQFRDRVPAVTRLILEVKSMAVEKSLPASIADHVQARLAEIDGEFDTGSPIDASTGAPNGDQPATAVPLPDLLPILPTSEDQEPMGGEAPCMANLFEDW